MIARKKRLEVGANAGSMADIAFLILIFFLTTTTIATEQGLLTRLPPWEEQATQMEVHERDVLRILLNSQNGLMADGQELGEEALAPLVAGFLLNRGARREWSESPQRAIVSLQADRGAGYEAYVAAIDRIRQGYYQARAQEGGISLEEYRLLDAQKPSDRALLDRLQEAVPMQLSEVDAPRQP